MIPKKDQILVIPVPQPSAGQNFSYTLPSGYIYKLISVQYTLTTSIQAASRFMRLDISYGGILMKRYIQIASQVASASGTHLWVNGGPLSGSGTLPFQGGLASDEWLYGGFVIASLVTSLQTLDQLSGIVIHCLAYTESEVNQLWLSTPLPTPVPSPTPTPTTFIGVAGCPPKLTIPVPSPPYRWYTSDEWSVASQLFPVPSAPLRPLGLGAYLIDSKDSVAIQEASQAGGKLSVIIVENPTQWFLWYVVVTCPEGVTPTPTPSPIPIIIPPPTGYLIFPVVITIYSFADQQAREIVEEIIRLLANIEPKRFPDPYGFQTDRELIRALLDQLRSLINAGLISAVNVPGLLYFIDQVSYIVNVLLTISPDP